MVIHNYESNLNYSYFSFILLIIFLFFSLFKYQEFTFFYLKFFTAIFLISFILDRNASELKTSVWANIGGSGALAKFHLDNEYACQGNNITCPVTQEKIYYYSQSVNIIKEYINTSVQVNWVITNKADEEKKNNDGAPIARDICIKFRAVVRSN